MNSPPRLLVTLCTYNERENLELLIPAIRAEAPEAEILVVDDNSPDGTGELVDALADADPHVRVIHRPGKQGLGTAMRAAFRQAIDQQYDLVLNLDADFSHPPRYIPALVAAARDRVDVAVGSRYCPGGGVRGWGIKRHVMSRMINLYSRLVLGVSIRDMSGSFRCYRVAKLREIDWSTIRATGYAIPEELLFRCRQVGCTFEEVPFVFEERRFGQTKINWREAVGVLATLLRIRLEKAARRTRTTLPSA